MKYLLPSLLIATLALCLVAFLKYIGSEKNQNDMNLVIISVDTLRVDHMTVYGYKKNTTPNIDAWAKGASVFTNAYTVMPITFHSFYTLFTGRDDVLKDRDMTTRYTNVDERASQILTLPKILKENKFKTAAFITNPVIGDANLIFFKAGFDYFNFINTSGIESKLPDIRVFNYDLQNAKEVTKRGKSWLEKNQDNRFFLWLHYTTPHMPYNPSKEYLCKIDKNCNSEIYDSMLRNLSTTENGILKSCTDEGVSAEIIEAAKNLYDAEILSVDEQIGQVLKEIERLNLSKKTMVVFYADHGEGFERNFFSHGDSLYNSAIRIPLIIEIPSKQHDIATNLLDNSDILPTILDVLRVPYDTRQVNGKSFASVFDRQKATGRKYVYSITSTENLNKRSIFDGTYKYIQSLNDYCLNHNQNEELYNLKTDPNENDNLVNKNIEIKNALRDKLMNSDIVVGSNDNSNSETIEKLRSLGY